MNSSGGKGGLKCPQFENITRLALFGSPQREHFQHCHLGKYILTCTWHLELSVQLSRQWRNQGEAVSDSPVSPTDPHREIISCELRCGEPLSKTHLPQQRHKMNTAALDLSGREDLAVQKVRAGEKKKENNRWDRCQPGVDSVFTQYQRKNFSLLNTNETRFITHFPLADGARLLISGTHTIGSLINLLQRLAHIVLGAKVTPETSSDSHWSFKTATPPD